MRAQKTPIEHLYLETGSLPIPYILSSRRLIYLKQILDRSDNEIIKRIYLFQKAKPDPGDLCHQIDEDLKKTGIHMREREIKETQYKDYKDIVKKII